jgi:hypothetical protein
MKTPHMLRLAVLIVLAATGWAPPTEAQKGSGPESSVVVGPARYDLTKSGPGFAAEASIAFRPGAGFLVLEPGLGYFTRRNDFGQRVNWFFPELSAQLEARLERWRPFIGAGGGLGVESGPTSDSWKATLHGLAGLRLRLGQSWGARAEVRWRAVPPFSGHTADLGVGFVRGMY